MNATRKMPCMNYSSPVNAKKLLLVDDVDYFLKQQKSLFASDGFDLSFARNGKEALMAALKNLPDLILMDQHMPLMNGDACCSELKAHPFLRHIPVIIVSSGEEESDFQRCWQAGCDDIVTKPVNPRYLQAVVKKHLKMETERSFEPTAFLQISCGNSNSRLLRDFSIDSSVKGLFIGCTEPLPEGSTLLLLIGRPGSDAIRMKAVVGWVNHPELPKDHRLPFGMGLQLVDFNLEDLSALRDLVQKGNLVPSW